MNQEEIIKALKVGLGPRQIQSMHVLAGAAHIVVEREGKHQALHIWVNQEEKDKAVETDFMWSIMFQPIQDGSFNKLSKEVQALPRELWCMLLQSKHSPIKITAKVALAIIV